MKFTIKSTKSGIWILGEDKTSVNYGIKFLKEKFNLTVFPMETKMNNIQSKEKYSCKIIF